MFIKTVSAHRHPAVFASGRFATLAGFAALGASNGSWAADDISEMAKQLEALRQSNEALAAKVAQLEEHANSEDWLTEARAAEIRGIVTDVLADSATRDSLSSSNSTAGWDKAKGGFFIESADGNYRLNIRGQVQVRFAYDSRNIDGLNVAPAPDEWGFEIRRLRLNFGGHIIDPSWTYLITPVWGRVAAGNLVGSATGGLDNAWIRKDFGDGFAMKIGQFQPLYAREESVSSAQQQAVERTTLNEIFSVRYSQGIQFEFGGRKEDAFRAALFYGDGLRAGAVFVPAASNLPAGTYAGTANTTFNANMADYAFCGRVEYLGGGTWNLMRDFSSFRGAGSGWMLGVGGMAQGLAPTTTAPQPASATDSMWAVLADANFKFDGASLFLGGFYRQVALEGDVAVRGGGVSDGMDQFGVIMQGGAFVSDKVELYARFEYGDTDTDKFRTALDGVHFQNASILTVGTNWFISGDHSLKWTNDFGYAFDPVGDFNAPGADWLVDTAGTTGNGITNDGQWLVRSQLQWLF
jgi:hypothetical protein